MHRYIVYPTAPWSEIFQSDTINGMLLCALGELQGSKALSAALEAFMQGEVPFAVSHILPYDAVPMPRLPTMPRHRVHECLQKSPIIQGERVLSLIETMRALKTFRKISHIPLTVWQKYAQDLSFELLFRDWCAAGLEKNGKSSWPKYPSKLGQEAHNTIDRRSNAVLQGGLYTRTWQYFAKDTALHLYVKANDLSLLTCLLEHIGCMGVGKDASTGKGLFTVQYDTTFDPAPLFTKEDSAPMYMLLSHCAAQSMHELDGYYGLEVKQGRVGPHLAHANPFKKPFLCLKEGSVLASLPKGPHLLQHIHSNADVIQVLSPITLPCRLHRDHARSVA